MSKIPAPISSMLAQLAKPEVLAATGALQIVGALRALIQEDCSTMGADDPYLLTPAQIDKAANIQGLEVFATLSPEDVAQLAGGLFDFYRSAREVFADLGFAEPALVAVQRLRKVTLSF